jgi:hypothetical protein
LGLLFLAVGGGQGAGAGSSLSKGSSGWLAARLYLEAQGTETELLRTRPSRWTEEVREGTVVITFPWAVEFRDGSAEAVLAYLRSGGEVLVAYTGQGRQAELDLLDELGLPDRKLRDEPGIHPLRWFRHVRETWSLRPEVEGPPPVVLRALDRGPVEGAANGGEGVATASSLRYLDREGRAVIRRLAPSGAAAGRLTLLPADALSNGRLREPGNGRLLEALRRELPQPWWFDEFHHGLAAPGEAGDEGSLRALDLAAVHLVALYLLGLWAVARPFGLQWKEEPAAPGSTAAFFLGLGALHHRLGHHREGARRLLARVEELFGEQDLPEKLRDGVRSGLEAQGFLALARRLAVRPRLSAKTSRVAKGPRKIEAENRSSDDAKRQGREPFGKENPS